MVTASVLSDFKRLLISDWKPFLFFGFLLGDGASKLNVGFGAPVILGTFDPVGVQDELKFWLLGVLGGLIDCIGDAIAGC